MKHFSLVTVSIIALYLPIAVFAQATYTPLVGIPGVDPAADFNEYINSLYALSISIAALLAVIKIVIAGVKWMTTDVVTSKGDAKKDIQGALIGLLIVLAAVLILTVINPNLTDVNLTLDNPATLALPTGSAGAAPVFTEPISTLPIGSSGATFNFIAPTASEEQKQLFLTDCQNTANAKPYTISSTLGSAVRCVNYSPTTQTVDLLQRCLTESCDTIIGNVVTGCIDAGGQWTTDPQIQSYGYCVKPK